MHKPVKWTMALIALGLSATPLLAGKPATTPAGPPAGPTAGVGPRDGFPVTRGIAIARAVAAHNAAFNRDDSPGG